MKFLERFKTMFGTQINSGLLEPKVTGRKKLKRL